MRDWANDAKQQYAELAGYAVMRTTELSHLLQPYVDATDLYGTLICEIVLVLGTITPTTIQDRAIRDLMADVFDFLFETRALILKGKVEIAYPLARRAYESLSLMVACHLSRRIANRWIAGKEVANADVRRILAQHPMGESEQKTRELYTFFSQTTHPNRKTMAARFLGDGNEFVLGSAGVPSLTLLADYALKTLSLWFWFGAFASFVYLPVLGEADPSLTKTYHAAAEAAARVAPWLAQQFNHVLAQEQAEMRQQAEGTKR